MLESQLTEAGYEIAWLPSEATPTVVQKLEALAGSGLADASRAEAVAELWSSGFQNLADLYLLGELSLRLRPFRGISGVDMSPFQNLSQAKVADGDGFIRGVRLDPEHNRAVVVSTQPIRVQGKHLPDEAIRQAVDAAQTGVEAFIAKLAEKLGPPSRMMVVYVKGLPNHATYEDFGTKLRQYGDIEKVTPAGFDPAVSKFLVTLTEQALITGDIPSRVRYLANIIDDEAGWNVVRTAPHSMMVEKVGNLEIRK